MKRCLYCKEPFVHRDEKRKCCSQSCSMKVVWRAPGYRARTSAAQRNWSPERRARMSATALKRWRDPKYRLRTTAAIREGLNKPRVRARIGAKIHERCKDPEYLKRMRATSLKLWRDPKYRARTLKAMRENWRDPKYRAHHIMILKRRYRNPNYYNEIVEHLRYVSRDPKRQAKRIKRWTKTIAERRINLKAFKMIVGEKEYQKIMKGQNNGMARLSIADKAMKRLEVSMRSDTFDQTPRSQHRKGISKS
jgi:hypothetical protein